MANMFTLEQLLAEENTTKVSPEQPSTEVITSDIKPVITTKDNRLFSLDQLLAEEESVNEERVVALEQSNVQRSVPSGDAGPQVPRADPVDDPLGADAALSSEMQSSIYNRERTLMEELSGYVTPEGTVVPSQYKEDSVLDEINRNRPEGAADVFDIDDMSEEETAKVKAEFIKEMTTFKTNEVRDPMQYLIAGVAKVDLKLGIKLADGIQYAMAGAGDFMIKDMELAKNGTYGVIGEQFYESAKNLLSGFGRFKKKSSPRELVLGYGEAIGAATEAMGASSLSTGTVSTMYSANAITKNIRTLKEQDAKRTARRNTVSLMEGATKEAAREAQERARKAAAVADNTVTQDVIESIEMKLGGRRISDGEVGNKVVNYDTVRNVGRSITYEAFDKQKLKEGRTTAEFMRDITPGAGDSSQQGVTDLARINTPNQTLYEPIMKPENIDALIAIADRYKKRFEGVKDADGVPLWNNKFPDGSKRPVIDILFDLTAKRDLIPDQQLVDDLAEFGMSFEEYGMSIIGDLSLAGTILQKASQLGKLTPARQLDFERNRAILEAESVPAKMWARLEGVRKGVMVSQFATMARNFTSTFIRAPLEGLFNVVDSAMIEYDKPIRLAKRGERPQGGFVGAGYKLISPDNWKRSFKLFELMYNRPDVASDMTDLLLKRPELAKQASMFYERVNDIQVARGRGTGTPADKILSEAEDIVGVLNIPNTLQEMMTRKAIFISELERTVFDNYNIDFRDALLEGKLPNLLKDTSDVRPEGAPSFLTLVDEANYRALAGTYAGEPQVPMLRELNRFIGKYGTLVEPFSRFLFSSMEFMGQSMGGASIPLTKKILNLTTMGTAYKDYSWNPKKPNPFTTKDRERVARNIVGIATVLAGIKLLKATGTETDEAEMVITGPTNDQIDAFLIKAEEEREYINNDKTLDPAYKKQEFARLDFEISEMLRARSEGVEINTTAIYPFAQFKYLSKAAIDVENGVFLDKFNYLEFRDLFLSSSLRSPNQFSVIEDVASMFEATDIGAGEEAARFAGEFMSNYVKSWLAQANQSINIDRARGYRTDVVKNLRTEDPSFMTTPTLDNIIPDPLGSAFEGPLDTAGITTTAEEERAAENKSNVFMPEGFRRRMQSSRVLLGVSATDRKTPEGEYLTKYAIDYKLGSKSKFPAVNTVENAMIEFELPDLVREAKEYEAEAKAAWDNPDSVYGKELSEGYRNNVTKENHVYFQVKGFLKDKIKEIKATVKENNWTETDLNEYQEAAIAYRRLTKDQKQKANRWLFAAQGEVNLLDTSQLEDLVLYIKNPDAFKLQ